MVGFEEIVGYRVGEGEIVGFGEPVGDDVVGSYVGDHVIDSVGSSDASSSLTVVVLKVGELLAFREVDGLDEAGIGLGTGVTGVICNCTEFKMHICFMLAPLINNQGWKGN